MRLFNDQAHEAADAIISAFKDPNSLPEPMATMFHRPACDIPCRRWSWRNRFLVAIHGHTDARGYRQWQAAGRSVKKGEKAFHILSPCNRRIEDKETGEKRTILTGFRGTPVFGYAQTEGKPLPQAEEEQKWIASLPFVEVAKAWGLRVEAYDGEAVEGLGWYSRGECIGLGCKNLSVWAHELVHAADHRNGALKELGQHWRSETVAQLGASVLLRLIGEEQEADLGGCWDYIRHYAKETDIEVVEACGLVLERTCEAVSLILAAAEALRQEAPEVVEA